MRLCDDQAYQKHFNNYPPGPGEQGHRDPFIGAVLSKVSPYKGDWEEINYFDKQVHDSVLIYFICIYVAGQAQTPTFIYNNQELKVTHPGVLSTLYSGVHRPVWDSTINS